MNKIIIANWKQNMTLKEVESWISEFGELAEGFKGDVDVVICPSHPYLSVVADFSRKFDWIHVGAQDISSFDPSSHTGETGADQAVDFVKYSIVGHSEREESRDLVAQKVEQCLKNDLIPIACFVEGNDGKEIYKDGVLVAWEDPENIVKDGVYSPKDPKEVKNGLNEIAEMLPENAQILYGGSVNRDTIKDLVGFENLGGVLVGTASRDPKNFFDIISAFN